MIKTLMAIGIVVLLSSAAALAQQPGACAADIKAKCAGVQPGQGKIRACIKEHLAEFSEPCRARLARAAEISKACAADVKKSCSGMERRRGRIRACIEGVLGNVSDQCREALAQTVAGRR